MTIKFHSFLYICATERFCRQLLVSNRGGLKGGGELGHPPWKTGGHPPLEKLRAQEGRAGAPSIPLILIFKRSFKTNFPEARRAAPVIPTKFSIIHTFSICYPHKLVMILT